MEIEPAVNESIPGALGCFSERKGFIELAPGGTCGKIFPAGRRAEIDGRLGRTFDHDGEIFDINAQKAVFIDSVEDIISEFGLFKIAVIHEVSGERGKCSTREGCNNDSKPEEVECQHEWCTYWLLVQIYSINYSAADMLNKEVMGSKLVC